MSETCLHKIFPKVKKYTNEWELRISVGEAIEKFYSNKTMDLIGIEEMTDMYIVHYKYFAKEEGL